MSKKLKVVAVSGGLQRPSRTYALLEEVLVALGSVLPIQVQLLNLADIAPQLAGAVQRGQVSSALESDLQAIEAADLLVVASPVYRASYTGIFKHLFDLIDHQALVGVPVLLAATGGSERHALVIDHQLRPLFAFFQALTLPIGVYAAEADFSNYSIVSPEVRARIQLAVQAALPVLAPLASLAPSTASVH